MVSLITKIQSVCLDFFRVLRSSRTPRKVLGFIRVENGTCLALKVGVGRAWEGGLPENNAYKCLVLSSSLSHHALLFLGNISGLPYNFAAQLMVVVVESLSLFFLE